MMNIYCIEKGSAHNIDIEVLHYDCKHVRKSIHVDRMIRGISQNENG